MSVLLDCRSYAREGGREGGGKYFVRVSYIGCCSLSPV